MRCSPRSAGTWKWDQPNLAQETLPPDEFFYQEYLEKEIHVDISVEIPWKTRTEIPFLFWVSS